MVNENHGKANYLAQSNALLRKNLAYQRRNKCQNCCLFVTPVLVLIILVVLQIYIDHALRQRVQPPPITNPPELPVALQLSDGSCTNYTSCHATFLATGANQSFGLGVVRDMFSALSQKTVPVVLGTGIVDGQIPSEKESHFYLQSNCDNISSNTSDPERTCVRGLTLWRNSSSQMNDEILSSKTARNSTVDQTVFTGAFDFLNSGGSNFNVTLWYDDQLGKSPTWILRLANMVSNAYLQYSRGNSSMILVYFIKDMPTHNFLSTPNLVALMSTLFFIWIVVWLFPVMLQALVYEKQHKLRMMMKMHGLGDGAYWSISYGYFAIVIRRS